MRSAESNDDGMLDLLELFFQSLSALRFILGVIATGLACFAIFLLFGHHPVGIVSGCVVGLAEFGCALFWQCRPRAGGPE